jgi:hypothetical protein
VIEPAGPPAPRPWEAGESAVRAARDGWPAVEPVVDGGGASLDHTDPEDLRDAYERHDTIAGAAEEFDVTYSAVFTRMKRHGIHQPDGGPPEPRSVDWDVLVPAVVPLTERDWSDVETDPMRDVLDDVITPTGGSKYGNHFHAPGVDPGTSLCDMLTDGERRALNSLPPSFTFGRWCDSCRELLAERGADVGLDDGVDVDSEELPEWLDDDPRTIVAESAVGRDVQEALTEIDRQDSMLDLSQRFGAPTTRQTRQLVDALELTDPSGQQLAPDEVLDERLPELWDYLRAVGEVSE